MRFEIAGMMRPIGRDKLKPGDLWFHEDDEDREWYLAVTLGNQDGDLRLVSNDMSRLGGTPPIHYRPPTVLIVTEPILIRKTMPAQGLDRAPSLSLILDPDRTGIRLLPKGSGGAQYFDLANGADFQPIHRQFEPAWAAFIKVDGQLVELFKVNAA